VSLGRDTGGEGVDVDVTWGRVWTPRRDILPRIVVARSDTPVLEKASEMLRAVAPRKGFELEGPVVNLHRTPDANVGIATVATVVGERVCQVKMELEEGSYKAAIEAHREQKSVRCRGILHRKGKEFRLLQASTLEILSE
jgi:hypothetical protein